MKILVKTFNKVCVLNLMNNLKMQQLEINLLIQLDNLIIIQLVNTLYVLNFLNFFVVLF